MFDTQSQHILLETSLSCFAFSKVSHDIIEIQRSQYICFYAHDRQAVLK